jgi:hypothetical protein
MKETLSVEIGCIYWRPLRRLVSSLQNEGLVIHLMEGRGWLSRYFLFIGSNAALLRVAAYIKRLAGE